MNDYGVSKSVATFPSLVQLGERARKGTSISEILLVWAVDHIVVCGMVYLRTFTFA